MMEHKEIDKTKLSAEELRSKNAKLKAEQQLRDEKAILKASISDLSKLFKGDRSERRRQAMGFKSKIRSKVRGELI